MRKMITLAVVAGAGMLASACAYDGHSHGGGLYDGGHRDGYYSTDYRSGNGYRGSHHYGRRLPSHLSISERIRLDPWLARTSAGQRFIRDHYDVSQYDTIDEDTAENANVFFRRWADIDRDYRLTDEEIRNALTHTANFYGLPHNDDLQAIAGEHPPHTGHRPEAQACDAAAAQHLVGQPFSQLLVNEAMEVSGARNLRWIPEGGVVTMDYRADRLNIEYAPDGRVLSIRCG